MEIRKLTTTEEIRQKYELGAMAFHYSFPEDKELETKPYTDYWGAVEGNKVISGMAVHKYEMMYHGKYMPTFGIGGVTTRAESRNKGYIRLLFEAVFAEMKKQGYIFSYLYPFSFRYYNKFGYTHSINLYSATIECTALTSYICDYDVALYQKGDSSEPYEKVFNAFASKYTGSIKRHDWKRLESYMPTVNEDYMYLFSKNGEPKAFFGFFARKAENNQDFDIKVNDIAWVDVEALHNVLGFIGGLHAHYKKCKLTLPTSLPIDRLIDEGKAMKVERYTCGQARIIDVEQALTNYPWPTDSNGKLSIKVEDEQFTDNNGVFTIVYNEQGSSVFRTEDAPDIEMNIRVLNALLMQTIDYKGLCYIKQKEYKVYRNEKTLEKVFVLGENFITEYY